MKNIFITGNPGVGKTTFIKEIISQLSCPFSGFYTEEIRVGKKRIGFRILTFDGKSGILAKVDHPSVFRVSKYGVNLEEFESVALPSLDPSRPAVVVIIDEIGKMECFSEKFRQRVLLLLESSKIVLATIAKKGKEFIEKIKTRPDVTVWELTPSNRTSLKNEILQQLKSVITNSYPGHDYFLPGRD